MGEKGLSRHGFELVNSELRHAGFDHSVEPRTAFNSTTGQNAVWDGEKGAWVDTKTLQPVTEPIFK
jgi:hypothetical protein